MMAAQTRRQARGPLALFTGLLVCLVPISVSAATFTVTNTNDSGPGSFRQAILNANGASGNDLIAFAIPGGGVHTIKPSSPLPPITDSVLIDGRTQPGYAGAPLVELSGSHISVGADGLHFVNVAAPSVGCCGVFGLVIGGFRDQPLSGGGHGIVLESSSNLLVEANVIGANPAGTKASGNTAAGVWVSGSRNNGIATNVIAFNGVGVLIDGSSPDNNQIQSNQIRANLQNGVSVLAGTGNDVGVGIAVPNFITENKMHGVLIAGSASATQVIGAYIGTDGSKALPNGGDGVRVDGATGVHFGGGFISGNSGNGIAIVGGASVVDVEQPVVGLAEDRSPLGNGLDGILISGSSSTSVLSCVVGANSLNGIHLAAGASGNSLTGNRIGVNDLGVAVPNLGNGVEISGGATSNSVGIPGAQFSNVISGNAGNGVHITDETTTGNAVQNVVIGTMADGTHPLPNAGYGVLIENGASGNTIAGGMYSSSVIAFNGKAGIFVESGVGNDLGRNSIHDNAGLGIDLAPAGVNPNDSGDADSGPNGLQNYPVLITNTQGANGAQTIEGSLDSNPNATYRIDFYLSPGCDPSGYGGGVTFLGSTPATTDSSGSASFSMDVAGVFMPASLTATATDSAGNTSEFSACLPVSAGFHTIPPCRLIDTRSTDAPALSAGVERTFIIEFECGIPLDTLALSVNVTVTEPSAQGHLVVFNGPGPPPGTSTLSYSAGQTRANNLIVPTYGGLNVLAVQPTGTVQVIIDVNGYFQ